jgi:hypothetical protein
MSQARVAHGFGYRQGGRVGLTLLGPQSGTGSSTGSTSSQSLSMLAALPLFVWHDGRSAPFTFLTSVPPEKSALSQAVIALSFSVFIAMSVFA